MEEFRAAREAVLQAERNLAAAKGEEYAVPVEFPVCWDYSVLENFWPAIDLGDLVVTVGDTEISDKNLAELHAKFSGQEGFTAHLYYRSFKEPTYAFQEKLPTL